MERNSHHLRSISLPSNSRSLTVCVEEQLCRLRSSNLATTSSSSICQNLVSLKVLYACVDDLLQLPLTQKSISSKPQQKLVDQVLDGSVKLLDVCGIAKDTLSQMKQSVQDLQSSLRRSTSDSDTANEVCNYMTSRKKGEKLIRKCLQDIKKVDHRSSPLSADNDMVAILTEVETITLTVFGSLLSSISNAKPRAEQHSWSLISKLKLTKSVTHKVESPRDTTCEFANASAALKTLTSPKSCKGVHYLKDVQKPLEAMEMSIQGFEDGLECVFRCLIKTRVSLLNILTQ